MPIFAFLFKRIASYHNIILSIAKLALPITIGQLGLILMGFSDIAMLGRLESTVPMAAAGFGNAVFFLLMLIGVGSMYAVSTITSIADGEGKPQQALPIFYSSLRVALAMGIVLMLLNLVVLQFLDYFGQSPELTRMGGEFIRIVNYSAPALMLYNAGKQVMDGLGKTQLSMYVTFFALLLNLLLNYLLIWGHWGFPAMGMAGSAWATVISRYVMAVIMLLWAWFHPLMKTFRLMPVTEANIVDSHEAVIEKKNYFWTILRIGIPVGFTFFFEIAAFSYGLILAGTISDNHSAAHQVAINLASITYMFVMGIAAAANILVGNFYGAKDKEGVRRSGFAAILLTVGIELLFAIIFMLFNDELPYIYTDKPAVLVLAPGLIMLAAFFQLSDGLQAVAAGALRGIKDTKVTGIIAFVSYWVIMIPGAYYLCKFTPMGLNGIWLAFVIGLSFAAVLLTGRFYIKTKFNNLQFSDET